MKYFLSTITLLMLISSTAYAHKGVVFVTGDYAPYSIGKNDRAEGIFPDIIRAVFKEMRTHLHFDLQPWGRCELDIENGRAFATFPYIKNEKRIKSFHFSDPVINFFPKFLYMKKRFKKSFKWKTLKDLTPYSIGGVRGYWYEQIFEKEKLNVQYSLSDKSNIGKLKLGRIDFTLIDELVGLKMIRELYPNSESEFAFASRPQSTAPFHLMVSKKYPNSKNLLKNFNQGLKIIKANGTYKKILQKYNVPLEYGVH